MSNRDPGVPVAIGFGTCFVLAGSFLLLQELDLATLRWTYVLPVIVVAVGLSVLLSGLVQAHRERRSESGQGSAVGGR